MAKEEILTLEQRKILNEFSQEEYLTRRFYFTGGTPLAAFYLFHRISEDLDFFSEQEVHLQRKCKGTCSPNLSLAISFFAGGGGF